MVSLRTFPDGAPDDKKMPLSCENEQRRLIATSRDRSLEQRVEAFEHIIETEVGDTELVRVESIDETARLGQIYLKLETQNPTGSHVVRAACAHVLEALRRGFDGVSVAARERKGAAFAYAAWLCGMRCTIHVPSTVQLRSTDQITGLGAAVVHVPGDFEAALAQSRQRARQEGLYDANAGAASSALDRRAYGQLAYEIYDELRDAPAAVAVADASGTLSLGIRQGFVSLQRRGKCSRVPRMVVGFPEHGRGRPHGPVNDAMNGGRGWSSSVSEAAMTAWSRELRDRLGIQVAPAATAGLAAFVDGCERASLEPDRYVIVMTDGSC